MGNEIRLTEHAMQVLRAFVDSPRRPLTGADIMRSTGLKSGTLYPILLRLERQTVLSSEWEDATPEELGRPRRRYYALSPAGAAFARGALATSQGAGFPASIAEGLA